MIPDKSAKTKYKNNGGHGIMVGIEKHVYVNTMQNQHQD